MTTKTNAALSEGFTIDLKSNDSGHDTNTSNKGRGNQGSEDIAKMNEDSVNTLYSYVSANESPLRDPYQIIDTKNWAFTQSESLITFFNFISPIDWALAKPYISFKAYGPYVVSYDKLAFDVWTEKRLNEFGTDSTFGTTENTNVGTNESIGSEAYFAPVTLSNTNSTFQNRANYHQKFKPLFAIEGLDVDIIQAPGAITFTDNIKMRLTIFDRSKLRELTALFNPDLGTHFSIEYGWQHPHAGKPNNKEDFPFDMYGLKAGFDGSFNEHSSKWKTIPDFINSLRHRGVYVLENFNITLGEGNQAIADLSLVSIFGSLATNDIGILNISFKETLLGLSSALSDLKKSAVKGQLGDSSSSSSLFSKKTKGKQLRDRISLLESGDTSSISKNKSRKFSKEVQIIKSSKDSIQERLNSFFSPKRSKQLFDGCFSQISESTIYSQYIYEPKIVSKKQKKGKNVDITLSGDGNNYAYLLGIIDGLFKDLGRDIKSIETTDVPSVFSDLVKNMYIRYYPFNNYCGLMSGKSVGSFVCKKQDITEKIYDAVASNPDFNISMERFFGIIESIISNKMNPNYGMSEFFDYAKNKPKEGDDVEQKYNDFIRGKSNGQFVLPRIRFRIISSPKTTAPSSEDGQDSVDSGVPTSYHVIIYDETNFDELGGINSKDFEDALFGDFKEKDKDVQPIEEIKKEIISKGNLPYVYPGTERSPIKKVSVKTESNDLMAAIYLEQNKDPNPLMSNRLTSQLDEIPLEYIPMEISVDMLGHPKIEPHNKIFFDFKTGTDIDSIYSINQIKHKINFAEFTTNFTCNPLQSYAKYKTIASIRDELYSVGDNEEDSSSSTSTKSSEIADNDLSAILRQVNSACAQLLKTDMNRLLTVKYFSESFKEKVLPRWKQSGDYLALVEWNHGLGVTGYGQFYRLMALLDLECYNLSKMIKSLHSAFLKAKDDVLIPEDIKADYETKMNSIVGAFSKSGLVGEVGERMNYAYFLTDIGVGIKDRDKIKKMIENAEDTLQTGVTADEIFQSKNVIMKLSRFLPYIDGAKDFDNFFPDYDPNNKNKEQYLNDSAKINFVLNKSKTGNSLYRTMYYNTYGDFYETPLRGAGDQKTISTFYSGGDSVDFGGGEIENDFLSDIKTEGTLPYLTFVEARFVEIAQAFKKLEKRYLGKMKKLAQVRDVFSDSAPQIDIKYTKRSHGKFTKYWVVVYLKSSAGSYAKGREIFKDFILAPNYIVAYKRAALMAFSDEKIEEILVHIKEERLSFVIDIFQEDKKTHVPPLVVPEDPNGKSFVYTF
jgi:hypothetical protein